jgi:1,4-alpha-glucan branching enzyme
MIRKFIISILTCLFVFQANAKPELFNTEENFAKQISDIERPISNINEIINSSSEAKLLPGGLKRGVNYIDDETVILLLYAPGKTQIYVVSELSAWQKQTTYLMHKEGDCFWIELTDLIPGKEYCYYYAIDNQVNVADPYAKKVLEKSFDPYISSVAYPDLTPFPANCTEKIVSIFQTAQPEIDYEWQVSDFKGPRKEHLIIYELLLRDFTNDGTTSAAYSSYLKLAIEQLDYIQSLGVNAVEIMPVIFQDGTPKAGSMNWGYHTTFFFALEKAYGTRQDYKLFVDECHKRGLAVILDIQLDHAWGTCPLVRMYADPVGNNQAKPAADNRWFNKISPNTHYTYGADFNHESPETRKLMKEIVAYWIQELKIDGYRFDFSKGLTQTPGEGSTYDPNRIAILKDYADTIRVHNPDAYLILEHFCDNAEEKELSSYGFMLWGKQHTVFNNAILGNSSNSGFSGGTASKLGWSEKLRVNYMESHDEERVAYNASIAGLAKNDLAYRMKRCGLGAVFLFSMPGPRMMWQFGEMGYDYSLLYSPSSTLLVKGQEGHAKPPRWDYLDVPERKALFEIYKTILNFRNQYGHIISDGTYVGNVDGWPVRTITYNHPDFNFYLVGNFGDSQVLQILPSGKWYDLFSGNVGVNMFFLQPGDFKVYTSKEISLSYSNVNNLSVVQNIQIFPNPVIDRFFVDIPNIKYVEFFSVDGRLIQVQNIDNEMVDVSNLQQGNYILRMTDNQHKIYTTQFIKK